MAVLLLAEIVGGEISIDQTGKALSAVKKLGDVTLLCASNDCSSAATAASKLEGIKNILCADSSLLQNGLAEPTADLIVSLAADYDHIAAPATSNAKNILPRVAALFLQWSSLM